jgi:hypothetical protein
VSGWTNPTSSKMMFPLSFSYILSLFIVLSGRLLNIYGVLEGVKPFLLVHPSALDLLFLGWNARVRWI